MLLSSVSSFQRSLPRPHSRSIKIFRFQILIQINWLEEVVSSANGIFVVVVLVVSRIIIL